MFLAHISDVKNNSWKVYPQLRNWALTNVDHKLSLVSNICRHQGSRLAGTSGDGVRTCPYHGWQYAMDGQPIHSGNTGCSNARALDSKDLHIENNFVFTDAVNLRELGFIDTRNLALVENRTDIVQANWRHIMDLFLDVNHIPVVHPGVYQEINVPTTSNIIWHYKDNASIQLVPRYEQLNDFNATILEADRSLKYGAAWAAVFPYTMIEWQPGAWFITVCVPQSDSVTAVNVYKYCDTRYVSKNWEINERVWETAWAQDKEQAERMTDYSAPDANFEQQKLHFRQWLNQVTI